MSKITREALLHIPRSNYCYGYDENTLHIRLRAKKGEVKSAFLRIGDQYIWDELEGGGGNLGSGGKVWISSCDIKMEKELETEYFDYFIAKYNPPTKRSIPLYGYSALWRMPLFRHREYLSCGRTRRSLPLFFQKQQSVSLRFYRLNRPLLSRRTTLAK